MTGLSEGVPTTMSEEDLLLEYIEDQKLIKCLNTFDKIKAPVAESPASEILMPPDTVDLQKRIFLQNDPGIAPSPFERQPSKLWDRIKRRLCALGNTMRRIRKSIDDALDQVCNWASSVWIF